jgi:FkbM family methyltransferase
MSAPITLDIGANAGQHSLFASIYSKEVIAFEPYPPVARKIQEKIDVNNIRNITLCLVGLGEKDAMLPFAVPDDPIRMCPVKCVNRLCMVPHFLACH